MATNNKKGSGLGLAAALVAAAAGTYYLYGKGGEKHRKLVRGWMLRAKGEVMDNIEKMDKVTEGAYHKVVEDVMKQYKKYKEVDKTELTNIARELRQAWRGISNIAKKSKVNTPKTSMSSKKSTRTAKKKTASSK